jgi:biopolymer transport protein ExbB/TolQ
MRLYNLIEHLAVIIPLWIGSISSLMVHTILFTLSFILYFVGVDLNTILLVVTTIVSLEAIYLSIFIQISMNLQAKQLNAVAEDVREIQEDVKEIQEEDEDEEEEYDKLLLSIESNLVKLNKEITLLKNKKTKTAI